MSTLRVPSNLSFMSSDRRIGLSVYGSLAPTAASFYPPTIHRVASVPSLAEQLHRSITSTMIYAGVHGVSDSMGNQEGVQITKCMRRKKHRLSVVLKNLRED